MNNRSLVVKAKGGMGNRMLCAATGILYSKITQRTPFVDWRDGVYGAKGENAYHNFFDCAPVSLDTHPRTSDSILPLVWKNNLHRSVEEMICDYDPDKHSSKFIHQKYSIDVRKSEYSSEVAVFWNYIDRINHLRRHYAKESSGYTGLNRADILAKFFKEEMLLKPRIRERINSFKRERWAANVIGVHVRYTDRKAPLATYDAAVQRLLKKTPGAVLFLATDNVRVSEWFNERYKCVISTPKWFPETEGPLHKSQACPDKTESGIEALIDMYLLSECDSLVFPGNSTFSWISSLLIKASDRDVIDILRWNPKITLAKWITEIIP